MAASMATWDSTLYLKFANERTQPAIDLAARIAMDSPGRVIDLGCGPGNSTAVLLRRWPKASVSGLDNSAAMLAQARRDSPSAHWIGGDIATWRADAAYDVVFSNAALQWVPAHEKVFPLLIQQVARDGMLA